MNLLPEFRINLFKPLHSDPKRNDCIDLNIQKIHPYCNNFSLWIENLIWF